MKTRAAVAMLLVILAARTAAQDGADPSAQERFTLRSSDCESVHTDGESWDECGFQASAMNATGNRVLTISVSGTVELWNERGENVSRILWRDQPSGAWGFPSAAVAIRGELGFAIIHANQLLVIDLNTGEERARHVLDVMSVRDLQVMPDGRLLAETRLRNWDSAIHVIDIATGQVTSAEAPPAFQQARREARLGSQQSVDRRVQLRAVVTSQVGDSAAGQAERNELQLVVSEIPTPLAPN